MKTKMNVLNKISKSINQLGDLELVIYVLTLVMGFIYVSWELGRAYARM